MALVQAIAADVLASEVASGDRTRPRGANEAEKVRLAVGVIVGAVLRQWGRTIPRPVSLDQSNEGLGELPGGRVAVALVVREMRSAGLLAFKPGVRWPSPDRFGFAQPADGRVSRIWPSPELLRRASDVRLSAATVKPAFPAPWLTKVPKSAPPVRVSTIRTRTQRDSLPLPPEALGEALHGLREEVEDWNAFAASVDVQGCRPPRWSRSFGPDVRLGGRWSALGSACYQQMPEDARLDIMIGGKPVAEVDVKASHLSIMHGLLSLPLPTGDPYSVPGANYRPAVKRWINATLGKGSAVARWSRTTPEDVKMHDAKMIGECVCRVYPWLREPAKAVAGVAGLIGLGGHGAPQLLLVHRLQAIEAEALTVAMRELRRLRGILTLPVHDSLVVPASPPNVIEDVMISAFEKVAGVRVAVEISGTTSAYA